MRAYLDGARSCRARVAVSAITLTEVLRGSPRDAAVHRVLSRITVVPVTAQIARRAGGMLGQTDYPVTGVPWMPWWRLPPSTWNAQSC